MRHVDTCGVVVDNVRTALERGATLHQTTNVVLVAAVKRVHFEEYDTTEAVRLLLENGSLVFAPESEHCPLCVALMCYTEMFGNALADCSKGLYFACDPEGNRYRGVVGFDEEHKDNYTHVKLATRRPTPFPDAAMPITRSKVGIVRGLLQYYARTHLFGELWFVQSHAVGCLTSACLVVDPDLMELYVTIVGDAVRHHCNILLQHPVLFGQYVAAWVYAVRSIMHSVVADIYEKEQYGNTTRVRTTQRSHANVSALVVAIIRNIPAVPLVLCPENEDALMHVFHAIGNFMGILHTEMSIPFLYNNDYISSIRIPAIIKFLLGLLPAGCGPMLDKAARYRAHTFKEGWNDQFNVQRALFWLVCARGVHYVRTDNDAVQEDKEGMISEPFLSMMYARGAASDDGIGARGGGPISLQELAAAAVPADEAEEVVRAGTVPHCVRHLLAWWAA